MKVSSFLESKARRLESMGFFLKESCEKSDIRVNRQPSDNGIP